MNKKWLGLGIISFLVALLFSGYLAIPVRAHWADLSVAEIVVDENSAQMTLTFPTGLLANADDDGDNQLSAAEVRRHQAEIERLLDDRIHLFDSNNQKGALTIQPMANLPANISAAGNTHSTLLLNYSWEEPIEGLKIRYNLFLPEVPTAHCLATIVRGEQVHSFIFTNHNQEFSLVSEPAWLSSSSFLVAIAVSFVWGGVHAMSPGHGKTIVGAYLAGSRATAKHAVFLGLTTTIAHTASVFALGLATLFASHFIVPERLYPWLSLLSGLMVVAIGLKLFFNRLGSFRHGKKAIGLHGTDHHHHDHHHHDHHHHDHHHHHVGVDSITWNSLLALGISGGIVPCPSALVLLLSTISLGRVDFGLILVLVFSLGLAGTLTALGLLLVSAKHLFEQLPTQIRLVGVLPVLSALFVAVLGLGITTQALIQIGMG